MRAERYRPNNCPHCNSKAPRCHGVYFRKSDRENAGNKNLNPIAIPRFYCAKCKRTCSVLPECIPPRRWYLWCMQQACILFYFGKSSFRYIAKNNLPSRWTISRWIRNLKKQFAIHSFYLKSYFSELGIFNDFERFWKNCLEKLTLSKLMLLLNNSGVVIP